MEGYSSQLIQPPLFRAEEKVSFSKKGFGERKGHFRDPVTNIWEIWDHEPGPLTPNLVLLPPLDQFTTWSRKFDYPSNLLPTCAATKIDTIWKPSHAKYCGRLPSLTLLLPQLMRSWSSITLLLEIWKLFLLYSFLSLNPTAQPGSKTTEDPLFREEGLDRSSDKHSPLF